MSSLASGITANKAMIEGRLRVNLKNAHLAHYAIEVQNGQ
jgi:hypothetical protein